ncbi:MAG: hypothetical protein K5790_00060 [Nitrosopumilus sp.]|uniref:hypothetical protein n=1 Tax=Nitrosopumilus sp. TaxID=2024843 RepID=UPI00247C7CA1|nr:hypothetical protein [Nitrosopumilus sp.]MCV0391671.1 hypothetical protein [Nitrosopumilus sp.]
MLAKSLVVFITIGVISGLGLGVYLIDLKNTSQLEFVDGPSISVVTEKTDFKRGEEIIIRIVNSGTTPLIFSDSSYGLRITGLSGILMYSPWVSAEEINPILEPRSEIEFSWNQIKNDGDSVLEGLYKISAKGMDSQGNKIEKSTTVTIWK